jgi:transcriptional regulator with XRE-family HTH domain
MISEKEIGIRIKNYRKSAGMTLKSLAEDTGFTKGYLSKVENSSKAPPVSTLIRIGKALKVDISKLFGESGGGGTLCMVRKNERVTMARTGTTSGYSFETLAHKYMHKHMEPYILTLPNNLKEIPMFKHNGEELFFVLKGKLNFTHGDRQYVLNAGDSIYFDSGIEHTGVAIGDEECKCLIVIYTPD